MKFPSVCTAALLLVAVTFLAGCTGTTASPPVSGTPVQHTDFTPLLLTGSEIPFTVAAEKDQVPDLTQGEFSALGAIRGFTRYSMSEKEDSDTAVQLGQMIVEYPPGNATIAFGGFVRQNLNADQSSYNITVYQDLGIGDVSCGVTVVDRSGSQKPIAMVVFTRGNIMESVVMISSKPDLLVLTQAARTAADKIP